jgi:hypothetical protein
MVVSVVGSPSDEKNHRLLDFNVSDAIQHFISLETEVVSHDGYNGRRRAENHVGNVARDDAGT